MKLQTEKYERVSNIAGLFWILLLTLPFVVWGGFKAFSVFSNDIRQWLPKGFVEAERYDWFKENFGVDEMIVASWEGCTLDDPRLPRLAHDLRQARSTDGEAVFSRVLTGPEMLASITDLNVAPDEAIRRCRGVFLGPDDATTCLLAFPSESASRNKTQVVDVLLATAKSSIDLNETETHIGGPTVDGAAIDRESKKSLQRFMGMTLVVVMFLTWIRLRNVLLTTVILGASVYCGVVSLAVLYWTGGTMNLTMIMLPTLSFILAVSGCVHMTNYFLKAKYVHQSPDPVMESVRYGAIPVFMASLTTALGMGSLCTSKILPIRQFGLYTALAVMVSLPVIIYFVPTVLCWLARTRSLIASKDELRDEGKVPMGIMLRLCSATSRRIPNLTVFAFLLVLVGLGIGAGYLESTVKVQGRFANSTKIIQDYVWMESRLGPLVPMEVVLRVPKDHPLTEWDRMRMVDSMEHSLRQGQHVNASYSAATFRPKLSNRRGALGGAADQLLREAWQGKLPQLEQIGLIRSAEDEQLWRISLRINAMNDIDYGYLLDVMQVSINDHLAKINHRLAETNQPPIAAIITGGVPMMYRAQHQVLSDLMISFLSAFLTISLVMMYVARSIWGGLIAMLPNILPPVTVFGFMGWIGQPIDIGSVMTASVAMGICVDGTIHMLAWYRRGMAEGMSKELAMQHSFKNCGKSMIDSTLICGLGVAPFMFSAFLPTVRFARLMLVMLIVGLGADLLMLPGLVLGPLGWFFVKSRQKKVDRVNVIAQSQRQNAA